MIYINNNTNIEVLNCSAHLKRWILKRFRTFFIALQDMPCYIRYTSSEIYNHDIIKWFKSWHSPKFFAEEQLYMLANLWKKYV